MTEKSATASKPAVTLAILAAITLCCLVPFLNRAFNIDDPLFIWVARQIQAHPLDFYGFQVNWYGTDMAASAVTKNPPLAAYYLALVAALTGWNEVPLHLGFLIPALAAVFGTYFLARLLTQNPLPAALLAILTPVFLLSSATVMCDTTMLALYVWAVFFWVRGSKELRGADLAVSSVLVGLCALSKYFGVSLIPLLFLYSVACGRDRIKHTLFLLIPVALLALYQWETLQLYGRGLLLDAASYATDVKGDRLATLAPNLVIGLSFTGGCFLSLLFCTGLVRDKRPLVKALLFIPLSALMVFVIKLPRPIPGAFYAVQLILFCAAGLLLLALVVRELANYRDPDSLLLGLWILGTFVFAAFVNWSVNGRSILPMAPAVGIVALRFLERRNGGSWRPSLPQIALPLGLAFVLSMAVTWADFSQAATGRKAARDITAKYGRSYRPLWFQGHWGFQYYSQLAGAIPYDRKRSVLEPGDLMVIPGNNTNIFPEIYDRGEPLEVVQLQPAGFLSTMNYEKGAGYYSSGFGLLPFVLGTGFDELYHVIKFSQQVTPS